MPKLCEDVEMYLYVSTTLAHNTIRAAIIMIHRPFRLSTLKSRKVQSFWSFEPIREKADNS